MVSRNGREQKPARLLTTEQVTVCTATLPVKTMRLGKRQITQAVFRQLVREQIVDPETLELRGQPWGNVRYFWAPCPYDFEGTSGAGQGYWDEHLHVVWQRDGLLRRACVGPE